MSLKEIRNRLVRCASRAIVGGFRPPEAPLASWFGRILVARSEETWPFSGSTPMMPLCQFNLTELPYQPDTLSDIAFLTVFIDRDDLPMHSPNGEGWLLRTYSRLDDLVPIQPPAEKWDIRPFPIRWEMLEADYPCWDDAASLDLPSNVEDRYHELFANQEGTKIGGWPTLVQAEIFWAPFNQHPAEPEYVFQIDGEEKAHWSWGDAGVGYFGRGTGDSRNEWMLSWQYF